MIRHEHFKPSDEDIILIHEQLEHLRNVNHPLFGEIIPQLSMEQISSYIEVAFWSSLLANENRYTRVRLAVVMQDMLPDIKQFSTPIPYDKFNIAKLSIVVPSTGYLLVDMNRKEIWAIYYQQLPFDTVVLDIIRPGVIKIRIGVYKNFMVIDGETSFRIYSTHLGLLTYINKVFPKKTAQGESDEIEAVNSENLAILEIIRNIQANGHGGTVLIVPDDNNGWSSHIDFGFRFKTIDSSIPNSIRMISNKNKEYYTVILKVLESSSITDDEKSILASNTIQNEWIDQNAICALSRLAALDGAIVITSSVKIIGFGAKIIFRKTAPDVSFIKPISDAHQPADCELEDTGGMRHQSAARFISANQNCAALVVSEDGPLSFIYWDREYNRVMVLKNADWLI